MRAFLLTLLLSGCGIGVLDWSPRPDGETQQDAINFVAEQFIADGWGDPRPVYVVWWDGYECLPGVPQTISQIVGTANHPKERMEGARCRVGRAWPTGYFCTVELIDRGEPDRLSDTSLTHEMMHCNIWDWEHQVDKAWTEEWGKVNAALWHAGL